MFEPISSFLKERNPFELLGSSGYSLPSTVDFDVYRVNDLIGKISNLNVIVNDNNVTGTVIIHRSHNLRGRLELNFSPWARDAIVIINENCTLNGRVDINSKNCAVILVGGVPTVGHSGHFHAQLWSVNNLLYIGAGSTTNGNSYVVSGENKSIIVGDDCMFAHGITLRTDDQHSVIDMANGKKLNAPDDIIIEPHVWIGQNAIVSKGVVIGLGSIVGAGSLVLKPCARFSVVAGVPATVKSLGRSWDRSGTPHPDTVAKLLQLDTEVKSFALPSFAPSLEDLPQNHKAQ